MKYRPRTWDPGSDVGGLSARGLAWLNELEVGVNSALPVFNLASYGAAGDGITDDSTPILAAVQAAYQAGGGTVFFPQTAAGVYLALSRIDIPNNGDATSPTTVPITFSGPVPMGGSHVEQELPTVFGVTLDLRSTSGGGKIVTHGHGNFTLKNLGLTQRGSAADTTPFVLTTGTALFMQDCWVRGYATLAGYTCVQNAIVLGGTSTNSDNTDNGKFRGYGSTIERCSFNRIKQVGILQTGCNGAVFQNNWIDGDCGDASGSAFLIQGVSSKHSHGNVISGNSVEVTNYKYGGVTFNYSDYNFVNNNGFYDPSSNTTSYYRIINNSQGNDARRNYYTSNSYEKLSGTGNLILDFLGAYSGAPMSASDAGAGSSYYDITVSKPAWSDGTTWNDATGTAI